VEWAWVAGESAPEPRRITDGKGTRKMNWKNGRPKGTVKAVWQKKGMAIKKKKKEINYSNFFASGVKSG
jgi:antitoxin component YwqK of YwqJK toxin-antitoxin module